MVENVPLLRFFCNTAMKKIDIIPVFKRLNRFSAPARNSYFRRTYLRSRLSFFSTFLPIATISKSIRAIHRDCRPCGSKSERRRIGLMPLSQFSPSVVQILDVSQLHISYSYTFCVIHFL